MLNEHPGATASEIAGHAATDIERSIKPASIRVELGNGGKPGRYVSDKGRWSLAVSDRVGGEPQQAALADPSPGTAPGGEVASDAASEKGGEGDGKPLGLDL